MYKYITRSKFTNPHLRSIFSNFWHLRVLFTRAFFSFLLPGEYATKMFANCIFKGRLGSEICLPESFKRAFVGRLAGKGTDP